MTTTAAAPPQTPKSATLAHTATVSADEFMRAVTNATLSAGTDDTLPVLCTIHFRPGHLPGTLLLEATDRYRASQEHIDLADLTTYDSDWDRAATAKHLADAHDVTGPEGYDSRSEEVIKAEHDAKHKRGAKPGHKHTTRPMPVTKLDVAVNAKDLARVVKTIKLVIDPDTKYLTGYERPHVVIGHAEDDEKVSFTLINNMGTDTAISPRRVDGDYPRIDTLMAAAELPTVEKLAAELAELTGEELTAKLTAEVQDRRYLFNPEFLASLAKIDPGERKLPVRFAFTAPGKPALVTIGERYRALIMPIRGA